ncbi:3-oxoacyl-ACP synthase [Affinibrenneria salicis]|uniref:3-oxoacyl-ACP synthase n=1 Tax=Affinibrenneria salicis TaxID=2590031 RepID=A0A5J5FQY5_9GAMM|nr:3-oxoacyl-ACP synthase [Affinibrenneria salicis]KAA8995163.1 3-oxoacyl-ACP synthase [Affinibrenneria salicis]
MSIYIKAVETYLPGPSITNEELGEKIGFKPELIYKLFGNKGRHFSTNIHTGKVTCTASDLIDIVIKALLQKSSMCKSSIDFIVVSTATPDYLLPTSLNEACFKLELGNIETYQILAGCSGAVQAIKLAHDLISCPDNDLHNGLVVGVESSFKFWDLDDDNSNKKSMKELVNYTLFGDGVGGCIVSDERDGASVQIKDVYYKYLGLNEKPGQLANWKGTRTNIDYQPMLQEEYKLIEKMVPVLTQDTMNILTEKLNKNPDWFMPPQLSGIMVEKICNKMGWNEKNIFTMVSDIGNCANAALYYQLKEFSDISFSGQSGTLISIESSRWLSSGINMIKL